MAILVALAMLLQTSAGVEDPLQAQIAALRAAKAKAPRNAAFELQIRHYERILAQQRAQTDYYPLQEGNRWTYAEESGGRRRQVTEKIVMFEGQLMHVNESIGYYMRLRKIGGSLFQWDMQDGRWERLYHFTAAPGTVYRVRMSHAAWSDMSVTVLSRSAEVRTESGLKFGNCVYLKMASGEQSYEIWFAPGVGMVKYVGRDGASVFESGTLESAVVGGRRIGGVDVAALKTVRLQDRTLIARPAPNATPSQPRRR